MTTMRTQGFTFIEILVVMGMVGILLALGTVRVADIGRRAPLTSTVTTVLADLRGAQTKAMAGANQTSDTISIGTTHYTVDSSVISLPDHITMTTTFPGSVIEFTKGSGDVAGFTPGSNTITVTQELTGEAKTITINRYGAAL